MVSLDAFTLLEPVARGGMAELWRGVHTQSDVPVAVKVLAAGEGAPDAFFTRALHAEAAAMAGLRSPYVVTVYDFGTVGARSARESGGRLVEGTPWIAMEWVGEGTLAAPRVITEWPQLRKVLRDLLSALAHAHAHGIVHRDLKPENVLIHQRAPIHVKLADFGIAFARDSWLDHKVGRPAGALTPRFAAPEQVQGLVGAQGPWTDLYLLGCVAWNLCCGAPPFRRRRGAQELLNAHLLAPAPELRPAFDVPEGLDAWVRRLMAKEPVDRFQRAPDALSALNALSGAEVRPVDAPPDWRVSVTTETAVGPGVGPGLYGLRPPPFAGREVERDRLWSLLTSVSRDGRPRAALVRGPSGSGTSRVAQWVVERAEELGVALGALGREREPGPTAGLAGMVGRWLGVTRERPNELPRVVADAVATRPNAPDSAALLELLQKGSLADRGSTFALAAAVLRWRADRPVVLWIDGVSEDGDLLPFARWLVATRALPVLLVVTEADEHLVDRPRATDLLRDLQPETFGLQPLPPAAMMALLDGLGAIDPATSAYVAEHAAGVPAVAVAVVRELASRGLLRPGPSGWRHASGSTVSLGEQGTAGWRRRLTSLLEEVPDGGPSLEVAAVLGARVDLEEWDEVEAELGIVRPRGLLLALLRALLLRAEDGTLGSVYRFAHPGFREVIVDGTGDRLVRVHEACAAALKRLGCTEPDRIGGHLLGCGHNDEAATLLLQGARDAGFRGDFARARVALDRADQALGPDDVRRIQLTWSQLERARTTGAIDEALHYVRVLIKLARDHGDVRGQMTALLQRAVLRTDGGDIAGGVKDAEDAVAIAGSDESLELTARPWLGMVYVKVGRFDDALALFRAIEPRVPNDYLVPYGIGCVYLDRGRPSDALVHLDRALERIHRSQDALNQALVRCVRAHALRLVGDLAGAEAYAQQAETALIGMGSSFVGEARVNLGLTRLAASDREGARRAFLAALAASEDARRAATVGMAYVSMCDGESPLPWLSRLDPSTPWMSRAMDVELAVLLTGIAAGSAPEVARAALVAARYLEKRCGRDREAADLTRRLQALGS